VRSGRYDVISITGKRITVVTLGSVAAIGAEEGSSGRRLARLRHPATSAPRSLAGGERTLSKPAQFMRIWPLMIDEKRDQEAQNTGSSRPDRNGSQRGKNYGIFSSPSAAGTDERHQAVHINRAFGVLRA
jgi:hypothetical protein